MKRAHRYLIFRVEDKTSVVIDKIGARDETFEQFKENMPKDGCRYSYSHILFISPL